MQFKIPFIAPVIISISLILISACAGKTAVDETNTDETVSEVAEPAAVETTAQSEESSQVAEVIPLGAATDSDTPADDIQQAAVKDGDVSTPSQEVIPNPDVTGITEKLLDHRNTLWHSRDKTYRLYVGTLFESEYSPDNKTFVIKSDAAGSDLVCTYTMDGKLDPEQQGQKKACSTLISTLENYLSGS